MGWGTEDQFENLHSMQYSGIIGWKYSIFQGVPYEQVG